MTQTSLFEEPDTDIYALLGNVYTDLEIRIAYKCTRKEIVSKINAYHPIFETIDKHASSMDFYHNYVNFTNALKIVDEYPDIELKGLSKNELSEIALKHNIGLDAIIVNVIYEEHISDLNYFYEDTRISEKYPETELKGKENFDVVIVNQNRYWCAYVYTPNNDKVFFESKIINDFKSRGCFGNVA